MVSAVSRQNVLPEFFCVEGVPVVEELLEDDTSSEEVPRDLVTFFRGSRTEREMCACLESHENQLYHLMGVLFSQTFARRYLPELFQHLLCRVNILLNVRSLYTTARVSDLRYSELNSHQKTVLRERLTDARKNELNELLRTFREYKERLAYSAEMQFLLNKVIRVLSDVLQDILYDNE